MEGRKEVEWVRRKREWKGKRKEEEEEEGGNRKERERNVRYFEVNFKGIGTRRSKAGIIRSKNQGSIGQK